jgi:acyl-CoA thioester hydrolase
MTEIPTYKGTVYPGQCDQMGHMNVLWYTAKFDEASWTFLSVLGIHTTYLRDAGRRMAAVKQTISYMKEVFAGDAITVATSLTHLGVTSLRFRHQMYRDCETEPVAFSELVAVHLDVATRRGCEFPATLRSKMYSLLERAPNAPIAWSTVGGAP